MYLIPHPLQTGHSCVRLAGDARSREGAVFRCTLMEVNNLHASLGASLGLVDSTRIVLFPTESPLYRPSLRSSRSVPYPTLLHLLCSSLHVNKSQMKQPEEKLKADKPGPRSIGLALKLCRCSLISTGLPSFGPGQRDYIMHERDLSLPPSGRDCQYHRRDI